MNISIDYKEVETPLEGFLDCPFEKPITNSLLLMFIGNTKDRLSSVLSQEDIEQVAIKIILDDFGPAGMEITGIDKAKQAEVMQELRA